MLWAIFAIVWESILHFPVTCRWQWRTSWAKVCSQSITLTANLKANFWTHIEREVNRKHTLSGTPHLPSFLPVFPQKRVCTGIQNVFLEPQVCPAKADKSWYGDKLGEVKEGHESNLLFPNRGQRFWIGRKSCLFVTILAHHHVRTRMRCYMICVSGSALNKEQNRSSGAAVGICPYFCLNMNILKPKSP